MEAGAEALCRFLGGVPVTVLFGVFEFPVVFETVLVKPPMLFVLDEFPLFVFADVPLLEPEPPQPENKKTGAAKSRKNTNAIRDFLESLFMSVSFL